MVESQTDQIVSRLREVSRLANYKIPPNCIRRLKTILGDLENCRLPLPAFVQAENGKAVVCVWQCLLRELMLEISAKGPMMFKSIVHLTDKEGIPIGVKTGEGVAPNPRHVDSLMAWLLSDKAAEA
jgi:hypothetical protein